MAFHFSLKALLRLRESLEIAELRRLQAMAADVIHARMAVESLDARIAADRRQAVVAAAGGISGAELHFSALREAAYRERRSMLLKKLAELERARQEQLLRYKKARQKREILENLRNRQLTAYQTEQTRREQQQIDELFLMRRNVDEDQ